MHSRNVSPLDKYSERIWVSSLLTKAYESLYKGRRHMCVLTASPRCVSLATQSPTQLRPRSARWELWSALRRHTCSHGPSANRIAQRPRHDGTKQTGKTTGIRFYWQKQNPNSSLFHTHPVDCTEKTHFVDPTTLDATDSQACWDMRAQPLQSQQAPKLQIRLSLRKWPTDKAKSSQVQPHLINVTTEKKLFLMS